MTPERFEKLREIFSAALERDLEGRARYLDEVCGSDAELRAEAERLLAADDATEGILLTNKGGVYARGSSAVSEMVGGFSNQAEVMHPERVGRYQIRGVLGTGGMGVVYRAEQENPRRTVALKVIRAGLTSRQMLRRFEHEAQILGRLQQPESPRSSRLARPTGGQRKSRQLAGRIDLGGAMVAKSGRCAAIPAAVYCRFLDQRGRFHGEYRHARSTARRGRGGGRAGEDARRHWHQPGGADHRPDSPAGGGGGSAGPSGHLHGAEPPRAGAD